MKVFIHAGLPKTGSTTLQASLFKAQDRFRPCGMLLPIFRATMPGHHLLSRISMTKADRDKQGDALELEKIFDARAKFITCLDEAAENGFDVLISTETLSNEGSFSSVERVRRLIEARGGHAIVLAYVRPPLKHMPSAISQEVRAVGGGIPIEKRAFAHIERAARLKELFGEENVELRIFDRGVLSGGEIVSDFVGWMKRKGAPMPDVPTAEVQNEAISASACALLWAMKEKLDDKGIDRDEAFKPILSLTLLFDRARPGTKLVLPETWIEPLAGLVADAWNELLDSTANPQAERDRFRLPASPQGLDAPLFSKAELFTPHLDRTYVAEVAAFGAGLERRPLRRAAEHLKEAFGV